MRGGGGTKLEMSPVLLDKVGLALSGNVTEKCRHISRCREEAAEDDGVDNGMLGKEDAHFCTFSFHKALILNLDGEKRRPRVVIMGITENSRSEGG